MSFLDVFFTGAFPGAAHTGIFMSITGFRLAAVIAVAAAAIIAIVIMLVRGRRRFSDYAAVLAAAAVLFAIILLVEFKLPSDYYSDTGTASDSDSIGVAVVSFDASAVAGRDGVSPENGVLLAPVSVPISEGETVLDLSLRAAKEAELPLALDASGTYISSVGGIGERAFGAYSGWVVYINGEFPSVGANELTVKDGDVIEWCYTTGEEFE